MPLDFLNMLTQFEQLDNQKEQLLLQRQEQASRNVAQAVGTLVTIAPEARAGYLEQMRAATGMDYGFLQALAMNTPTPQSILVARGFERAMQSGDVSDVSLAANTLGMTPIAFQTQQQVSQYMKDGTVPDMIKRLPPELQQQALFNLVTASAGLPDTTQLDLQVNPLLTRDERRTSAQVGADLRPGAKQVFGEQNENSRNSARVGVQYAGIASNERQSNLDRNLRRDQGLMQNSTQLALGELGARVNMSQAAASGGRGGRGGAGAADGIVDPVSGFTYKQLMDLKTTAENQAAGALAARNGFFGAMQSPQDETVATSSMGTLQFANEALDRINRSLNPQTQVPGAPAMNNQPTFNTVQPPTINPFGPGLGAAGLIGSGITTSRASR
jgi:hypothetical protein